MQDPACHLYAYAIPSKEAIHTIRAHGPILEVGAGTGYWASLINDKDTEIAAYDKDPGPYQKFGFNNMKTAAPTSCSNEYHGDMPSFFKVKRGGAEVVSKKQYRNHTLFLCYPPPDDPMSYKCLQSYKGQVFLYVGEWRGNTGFRCLFLEIYF